MAKTLIVITDCALSISGRLLKIATVRDEPYDCIKDPARLIAALKTHQSRVDIFSFVHDIADAAPRYFYHAELASFAVLPITTYEHWWKHQINDKTRNLVRKAQKSNVDTRIVSLDDELVKAIKDIYDESPVRQGKRFAHFQKPIATIRAELSTFPDRSTFIGAYNQEGLVGFAKLVQGRGVASLMHIISKLSERNKAPTNALISKAVEICGERGVGYLHYGVWSIGGLGLFKENHAFQKLDIPRYFVPITFRGRIALRLGMHRRFRERLPERWRERISALRNLLMSVRSVVKSN
jgi:hypothetical protein